MDHGEFTNLALQLHSGADPVAVTRHYSAWKKSCPNGTPNDAKVYLEMHYPNENAVSLWGLLQAYEETTPHAVSMAEKWISQQKLLVDQTICGPYLSPETAVSLKSFLNTAIPVRPEFDSFCCKNGLDKTPAVFANFVSFARKDITKTNYHPFCSEKEYWLGSVTSLYELFQGWSVSYTMSQPSPLPNYLSIAEAAEMLGITAKQLFAWLQQHAASCVLHKGQWLLAATIVDQLHTDWGSTTPIVSLLPALLDKLPAGKRNGAIQFVLEELHVYPDWIIPKGAFPQQDNSKYYTKDVNTAAYHLLRIVSQYPALPLRDLQELTRLNLRQLKDKASAGIISATLIGDASFVTLAEQQRIFSVNAQFISLDDLVEKLLSEQDIFTISKQDHRNNLLAFLENNDWFGVEFISGDEMPLYSGRFNLLLLRSEATDIQERLQLWLKGYKKPYANQIAMLLDAYMSKLPKTVSALRDYIKYLWELQKSDVDMIDTLLYWLPKELHQMSRQELNKCIMDNFARCTLSSCDALNRFLTQKRFIRSPYIFERTGIKIETSAYSPEAYATMVAPIVNEQVIQDLQLVEKAIQNKKYADLWLYIALHMFASIRSTDCTALYEPPLPCHPTEVLRQIQSNEFSDQEAYKIAFSFIHQVTAFQMRPNKTKDTGLSANLYISCPESCMPAFGRIIAIASAHQIIAQASQLVQPVTDIHTIRSFFGPVFAAACDNNAFSGRRANKSLMQAVKANAEEAGHNPLLAYVLASRMRSHRGSYESIAPTTAIYLRNSSFTNLTTDDIAYLLMERGVCSFATDYMLKTCFGEKYTQLSAASQTEVIRSIGCHVSHLDKAMRQVQYAMDVAIATVNAIVQHKPMKDVLTTLALGCAPGKEQGSMCMCKAADMQCQEPSRLNCLGCKYEVKTKALLVKYIIAYNEMWADTEGLLDTDIQRQRWLANHIYAPAIGEIQAHLLETTTDMNVYNQLVQEVSEHAGAENCA